jgi:transcriptional regulator of acetoin/glycerol metabolism
MLIRVTSAQVSSGSWLDENAFRHLARRAPLPGQGLRAQRMESEKEFLRLLVERHGGNIASAAREIAMSRQGLHKALRRAGLI